MKNVAKELEKIEDSKEFWNSDFIREMEIWEEIAMQINSYKGKEKKFWEEVMDLHKSKRNEKNQRIHLHNNYKLDI